MILVASVTFVLGVFIGFFLLKRKLAGRTSIESQSLDLTPVDWLPFSSKCVHDGPHQPYSPSHRVEARLAMRNAMRFARVMSQRRSIRHFSADPIDMNALNLCVRIACNAPSGANMQPWTWVIVTNKEVKREIRSIVEKEEKVNYEKRMNAKWKSDLEPLGTNWQKEYLEVAPALVIVFKQPYGVDTQTQQRVQHYYVEESVNIAVGVFLAAITHCGFVTLTSTPMNAGPALRDVLKRPKHEKVVLLLPVGYAHKEAKVPRIARKPLEECIQYIKD